MHVYEFTSVNEIGLMMEKTVLWDAVPCRLVEVYQR
jgi:hypothetical protein